MYDVENSITIVIITLATTITVDKAVTIQAKRSMKGSSYSIR